MDIIQMFIAALLANKVVTPEKAQEIEETFAARSIGGTQSAFIGGALTGNLIDMAYGNGVWIDAAAAGGTTYPAGTRRYPCATLAEARTVAAAQGLNRYYFVPGIYALDADMNDAMFVGNSMADTFIVANGFSIDDSLFVEIGLLGDAHLAAVDTILAYKASIGITTNPVNIVAVESYFMAATLYVEDAVALLNCTAAGALVIDATATTGGGALAVVGLKGGTITYQNLTAAITADFNGRGILNLAASDTAGTINAQGDIVLNDASGGSVVNDYTLWTGIAALVARLTAARAGYIDELAAANIPADVDGLKGSRDRTRCGLRPVGSALIEEVSITDGATDTALGSIVVNTIPAGATVTFAQLIFVYGAIENTAAGVNKLNGAQNIQIQKGAGAWADAIAFPDDYFTLGATTREGGGTVFGTINLSATVTGNDTYSFQWDEAVADADFLLFNNVQMLLYIEYSI